MGKPLKYIKTGKLNVALFCNKGTKGIFTNIQITKKWKDKNDAEWNERNVVLTELEVFKLKTMLDVICTEICKIDVMNKKKSN